MARLKKHPKGHPTYFTNPTTGKKEWGEIEEEVWLKDPADFAPVAPDNDGWREIAVVAQRLLYPSGYRAVRITYYVRSSGQGDDGWSFGGQYAATPSEEDFAVLIRKILAAGWVTP